MKPVKETVIRDFSDAVRLDNFRIDPDGGLKKREGYSFKSYLDGKVRGAIDDYETTYLVSGYSFYKYADDILSHIGTLDEAYFDDENEAVSLFIHARNIFIMGGGALYRYTPDTGSFDSIEGYTPLVIRNSNAALSSYEEYEPLNLISKTVRCHYNLLSGTTTYYLWGNASSLKAIYADGALVRSNYYTAYIQGASSYITFKTFFYTGQTDLVIEYTLDPSFHSGLTSQLFKGTKASFYEHEGEARMLIYGGSLKDKVYVSEYSRFDPIDSITGLHKTTNSKGEECSTIYEIQQSYIKDRFNYFTKTGFAEVGFDGETVRAVERLSDHYMVFSKSGIYRAEHLDGLNNGKNLKTSGIKTVLITDEYGIGQASGTAVYEDSLYFYNENGLYRYRYNSTTNDFISASIPIVDYAAPDRKASDRVSLFLYRRYGELWCCYDGYASVYDLKRKRWSRFSGIDTDLLFCCDSHAAFSKGSCLYVFDESNYTDGGVGFEAVFESKNYDLGSKFSTKVLYGFGVCLDRIIGATIEAAVTSDKGVSLALSYSPNANSSVSPSVMRSHARLSSVSFVKCTLVSPADNAPANVREIMFRYREMG